MSLETSFNLKTINENIKPHYYVIEKLLKDVIKNEGFVKYNIDVTIHPKDGTSFLGVHMDITITGDTNEKKKTNNLFLKMMTNNETITFLSLPEVYEKELFVYQELAPVFKDLQDEVFLKTDKRFKMAKAYDQTNPSIIILENLMNKGYKSSSNTQSITLEYAKEAVKEIAKFHALSFVLKSKRPKYFETKIESINQPFTFNSDYKAYINNMCELTLSFLNGEMRRKFEDFVPKIMDKLIRYWTSKCGRDVLCHGDYKPSNILTKEIDGVIKDMITIDYQIIYYGCPIMDLLYFIFLSTDQRFRRSNLLYLYDLYYDRLGTFLKYFALDVSTVYPREEFERHLKERLDYGLIAAISVLPILMSHTDEVPDITNVALADINVNSKNDTFKERIIEVVEDFIAWGYL